MLLDELEKTEKMTTAEQKVARFLLANPEAALHMTAAQIGKRTFTSKTTVLRLCQKIGFAGFTEVQKKLVIEAAAKKQLLEASKQRPINQDTQFDQVANNVKAMYDKILTRSCLEVNPHILQRVVKRLKNTTMIDVYSTGITESCAAAAAFKLRTLGIQSAVQTNINEHYLAATRKEQQRAAILLSFTGGNPMMVETASYLKKMDVYLIGIGGLADLALSQLTNEYFVIPTTDQTLNMEAVNAVAAVNYMLDVLFAALTVSRYEQVVKNSVKLIERRKDPK